MKKIFTPVLFLLFITGVVTTSVAQTSPFPKRYVNFGYVMQNVDFQNSEMSNLIGGKAEWGASVETGTTYFLHKNPIAGMVRLGIDFAYLNVQYAQYKYMFENETVNHHYGEIGMEIGFSATVTPLPNLHLMGYVRYAPSMSAYFSEDGDNILGGYAGLLVGGISASYRTFTLGFQLRGGEATFSDIKSAADKLEDGYEGSLFSDKQKVKLPSTRLYVGFRF